MVKEGTRIIEGVNVAVTKIQQLLTPQPRVSDKDSEDIGQKIRYLIDRAEDILGKLDVALGSRASEATVSTFSGKFKAQFGDLFVKDLSVGSAAVQVDSDGSYRDEVILLADSSNTDKVYVGGAAAQLFPLAAGAAVAIRKTQLNLIYVRAASGTQTVHIICGGA
jgi:hypothetical protein